MDVKVPPLGEGADSGTVVNLFVKEGDQITEAQPVLELENEKAVATIPSTAAGVVDKVHVKVGDKISVGQRVLSVSDAKGDGSTPAKTKPAPAAPKAKAPAAQPEPERESAPEEPESDSDVSPAASPTIRKLARELGLDLKRVRGTARGGRITMEDLRAHI